MSNAVYPVLPGLTFPTRRTPVWKTSVKTTPSGRTWRRALSRYPRYRISLQYAYLRSSAAHAEFQTLFGFFNARGGAADSFLFLCPDDRIATAQSLGVGTGAATQWQLVREIGGFVEPVFDLVAAPQVFANGVMLVGGYTVSDQGLVTFATPPAAGVALSWSGSYYWRCTFDADDLPLERFMHDFWRTGEVSLITERP